MKELSMPQMEEFNAFGDGQDLAGGVLCGLGLGLAIPSGGYSLFLAAASCGVLFGDW